MKEWMPIEEQPNARSNGHRVRRGRGDSGAAAVGALSVDATVSGAVSEVRPPASPPGSGSIHPAFLPETKPEDLWKRDHGDDGVDTGTWYGAMGVTCCVVVEESYGAILVRARVASAAQFIATRTHRTTCFSSHPSSPSLRSAWAPLYAGLSHATTRSFVASSGAGASAARRLSDASGSTRMTARPSARSGACRASSCGGRLARATARCGCQSDLLTNSRLSAGCSQ